MKYIFDLCLKCKDKLIERTVEDFEAYNDICCPNCGSRMDAVFEGDLLNTYLNLQCLDEIGYMVDYIVEPDFPYARFFIQVCPDCGEKAVYKQEYLSEDEIMQGFFCEKCNEWVWYDIHDKSWLDETIYHLKASLEGIEGKGRQDIIEMTNGLHDKKMAGDQVEVHDLARNIGELLGMMKTYDVDYEVFPPYPHKIIKFQTEWTEEAIQKLIAANPGLTITAEELNSLK